MAILIPSRNAVPLVLALGVPLGLAGCDLVRDPAGVDTGESRIQVNGMLVAGKDDAAILITRARQHGFDAPQPVRDAVVRLVDGADTVLLLAGPEGADQPCVRGFMRGDEDYAPGCYAGTFPEPVRSGETYELLIELPDGTPVTGRTTVPEPPVLLAPTTADTFLVTGQTSGVQGPPLTARWEPIADPFTVYLHVEAPPADCHASINEIEHSGGTSHLDVEGRDSLTFAIRSLSCEGDPPPAEFEGYVVLTRFDPAYSEYADRLYRGSNEIYEDDAAPGLTGAVGAFASLAQDRRPVVFRVSSPLRPSRRLVSPGPAALCNNER